MTFEDGAVCTVLNDSSLPSKAVYDKYPPPFLCNCLCFLFTKRMNGNCFIYNVKFTGVNFPLNGPVMQKRTQGWEPNTERLYARDGMLIGNNFMALRLEGGGHYTCEFRSTYK
ncbi:unnamed protein product [Porites lobata]|uniref:Uncharacterized protein n=1 Tax=Porites lobata TaxID=104759 RepID=A0ABN8Q4C6_9CNID|nr:unnamed protein product [Porites lobata]